MSNAKTFKNAESKTKFDILIPSFAILLWGFIIYYAISLPLSRGEFVIIVLGGSVLFYLFNEINKSLAAGRRLELAALTASAIIDIVVTVYMFTNYSVLIGERVGVYYSYEYLLAVLFTAAIMYLTYRAFGLAVVSAFTVIVLYGYFGESLPGILAHGGLGVERLLSLQILGLGGFYGSITQIVSAWVALFLLYTGLAQAYGAFDLILRLASKVAKHSRSGVAQFAVIASMIVGSINGSPSANTAMTGSITIPMMKESGLPGRAAGAVEATASSSGQIVPPVMGSAAFIMASILGITYLDVVVAGIFPVVIFGASIVVGVHYISVRYAPGGLNPDIDLSEVKAHSSGWETLYDATMFLIPFLVLVYLLAIAQWTIMTSAMATVFIQIGTGMIFPLAKPFLFSEAETSIRKSIVTQAYRTLEGLIIGATVFSPIMIIIALINGLIDTLAATGLSGTLSLTLISLSQGTLLVAGILAIIICILLGMGMPSVAAYSIVAILVAPTFATQFDVPELAAHYFVFYSVILSFFTPPVATAAVIASGIAEANFLETCISCIRICLILFILPIAILFNPIIVVGGPLGLMLLTVVVILLGGISVTHGVNYPGTVSSKRTIDYLLRAIFVLAGLIIAIHPNLNLSIAVLLGVGALLAAQYNVALKNSLTRALQGVK